MILRYCLRTKHLQKTKQFSVRHFVRHIWNGLLPNVCQCAIPFFMCKCHGRLLRTRQCFIPRRTVLDECILPPFDTNYVIGDDTIRTRAPFSSLHFRWLHCEYLFARLHGKYMSIDGFILQRGQLHQFFECVDSIPPRMSHDIHNRMK